MKTIDENPFENNLNYFESDLNRVLGRKSVPEKEKFDPNKVIKKRDIFKFKTEKNLIKEEIEMPESEPVNIKDIRKSLGKINEE